VGEDITHRTMEQHVYKLRKKLGLSHSRGVAIRALYSQGYRLEVAQVEDTAAVPLPRVTALPQVPRNKVIGGWAPAEMIVAL
jgi:hypothetical protein